MKTDIEENKLLGKVKQDCFKVSENLGVITIGSKKDDDCYLQLYNEQALSRNL